MSKEVAIDILREMEDYRNGHGSQYDFGVRMCQAILADKIGFESRNEWTGMLKMSEPVKGILEKDIRIENYEEDAKTIQLFVGMLEGFLNSESGCGIFDQDEPFSCAYYKPEENNGIACIYVNEKEIPLWKIEEGAAIICTADTLHALDDCLRCYQDICDAYRMVRYFKKNKNTLYLHIGNVDFLLLDAKSGDICETESSQQSAKYLERVKRTMSDELQNIYKEEGVLYGDISVEEQLKWNTLCEQFADLMQDLVNKNKTHQNIN